MVKEVREENCSEEFMDAGQYQRNGILRYEKVFGHTFISTGGKQTTEVHSIHLMIICVINFDLRFQLCTYCDCQKNYIYSQVSISLISIFPK